MWITVGVLSGFGLIGILSIGLPLLVAAVGLAVYGVSSGRAGRGAALSLVGVAAAPFFIAWFNRAGPGEVCSVDGSTQKCEEMVNPLPFLIVGLVMVAAGLFFGLRRRRQPPMQPAPTA